MGHRGAGTGVSGGARGLAVALLLAATLASCGRGASPRVATSIRLATTTSARDTGLLDALLPAFRADTGIDVQPIAVGTGEALALGARGDADVVLVHAREAEDAFLAAGHGVERRDVWWNRFAIYGPASDPASVAASTAADALARIRGKGAVFVSRGDRSGTHMKEVALWGGKVVPWDAYFETGQGMGPTLVVADEKDAYVLSDEGTYLRMRSRLRLVPLVRSDPALRNPYGVILVRPLPDAPDRHEAARRFVGWVTGPRAREIVRGLATDGERLFWLPDESPAPR